MTTSSNEAKTPLANVSGLKDNLGSSEFDRLKAHKERILAEDARADRVEWLFRQKLGAEWAARGREWVDNYDATINSGGVIARDTKKLFSGVADLLREMVRTIETLALPITQNSASASAQTQDVTDHSPAAPPESVSGEHLFPHTIPYVSESESSISSTLAEITHRWEGNRPYAPPFEICQKDVLTLLGIIDSLKAKVDEWESHREGLVEAITTAENAAESAASNMKAAILQRVREFDVDLADQLEVIQL